MSRRSFLVAVLFFTLFPVLLAPGGRGLSLAATKSISVTPRLQSKLAEGKRYALIIGIGRYRDRRIPPLRYTVADARAMYDVLTDPRHGRFPKGNVRLLLDERATLVNIRKGLNWLVRESGEDDTVVVYYSGHGAPEGGETFWVSYDADIDDIASTAVENRYITGRLERIKAKRLASFLDSCYSAAIVEKRDAPKALFDQDFFTNYQGTGRVTITASDGKQLSLESEDFGHGIFTYFLLEALRGKADRNGDGAVEIEEVWAHLRRKVTDEARRRNNTQEPRIIGSFSAGFLLSLNPAALERERVRREALTRLLRDKRITGVEFEEAVGVLDGEIGGKRGALLLPLVRQLADGRLMPGAYRLALAGVTARLAPGRAGSPGGRPGSPVKPPAPAPPVPLPADKFSALLAKADALIAHKRLTTPKGGNAYQLLMAANVLRPSHPEVAKRLGKIAGMYLGWARARLRAGDLHRARAYLEKARRITPEDPAIRDLREAVERAERKRREEERKRPEADKPM